MERIKKLFNSSNSQHHRKSKSDQTVIVSQAAKRKRFSLVLLKSAIDPNHEQPLQQERKKRPTTKHISKSTSFLQLQSFGNSSGALKKSRSMFGQLASFNKPAVGNLETEAATNSSSFIAESVFQDYYNSHAPESDILHTAAVSISSAYNTINNNNNDNKLFALSGGNTNVHQNSHLQLGIQFYEKGELENATHYWRLAAEENEMIAIFFYGLALRHGWGCRKSPAIALRYLQKTTNEFTPIELQTALSRLVDAVKIESLACSIYELGEFFWHGWEVPKSVAIATWYFQLASNMGNPNAMNDLGFCFRYGHGVTKDDQQAAKLYRKAAKHGFSLENNSWIWDSQYDDDEKDE